MPNDGTASITYLVEADPVLKGEFVLGMDPVLSNAVISSVSEEIVVKPEIPLPLSGNSGQVILSSATWGMPRVFSRRAVGAGLAQNNILVVSQAFFDDYDAGLRFGSAGHWEGPGGITLPSGYGIVKDVIGLNDAILVVALSSNIINIYAYDTVTGAIVTSIQETPPFMNVSTVAFVSWKGNIRLFVFGLAGQNEIRVYEIDEDFVMTYAGPHAFFSDSVVAASGVERQGAIVLVYVKSDGRVKSAASVDGGENWTARGEISLFVGSPETAVVQGNLLDPQAKLVAGTKILSVLVKAKRRSDLTDVSSALVDGFVEAVSLDSQTWSYRQKATGTPPLRDGTDLLLSRSVIAQSVGQDIDLDIGTSHSSVRRVVNTAIREPVVYSYTPVADLLIDSTDSFSFLGGSVSGVGKVFKRQASLCLDPFGAEIRGLPFLSVPVSRAVSQPPDLKFLALPLSTLTFDRHEELLDLYHTDRTSFGWDETVAGNAVVGQSGGRLRFDTFGGDAVFSLAVERSAVSAIVQVLSAADDATAGSVFVRLVKNGLSLPDGTSGQGDTYSVRLGLDSSNVEIREEIRNAVLFSGPLDMSVERELSLFALLGPTSDVDSTQKLYAALYERPVFEPEAVAAASFASRDFTFVGGSSILPSGFDVTSSPVQPGDPSKVEFGNKATSASVLWGHIRSPSDAEWARGYNTIRVAAAEFSTFRSQVLSGVRYSAAGSVFRSSDSWEVKTVGASARPGLGLAVGNEAVDRSSDTFFSTKSDDEDFEIVFDLEKAGIDFADVDFLVMGGTNFQTSVLDFFLGEPDGIPDYRFYFDSFLADGVVTSSTKRSVSDSTASFLPGFLAGHYIRIANEVFTIDDNDATEFFLTKDDGTDFELSIPFGSSYTVFRPFFVRVLNNFVRFRTARLTISSQPTSHGFFVVTDFNLARGLRLPALTDPVSESRDQPTEDLTFDSGRVRAVGTSENDIRTLSLLMEVLEVGEFGDILAVMRQASKGQRTWLVIDYARPRQRLFLAQLVEGQDFDTQAVDVRSGSLIFEVIPYGP